ncbi:MAG: hypothetical protein DMG82_23935 [Acidobacteria bacterium]|nr:MAG: hypothetical protein DMG82_23935 [Acidobacteriota bacterium]
MKFSKIMGAGMMGVLLASLAAAGDKKDSAQMVDSGSLGIFINGRRIATESFSIQQTANGSNITSNFKTEEGVDKAAQTSELQLTPSGDIRKYEWKEVSPGKSMATVAPSNDYLMERISNGSNEKPEEQPFLLPASTSILDDYAFIHRQVLIWRYLATTCKQEKDGVKCPANQKTQFGAMNPHQRTSLPLTVEFSGRDKTSIRGTEREMNKFVLRSEGGDWTMWLDDHFKLQRILIASDNTEVVRD